MRDEAAGPDPDSRRPAVVYVGPVPPLRGGIAQHGGQVAAAIEQAGASVRVESWARQYPGLLYRRPETDPEASPHPGARFSLRWFDPIGWRRVGLGTRGADRLVVPWTHPIVAPAYLTMIRTARVPVSIMVHNALPHEHFPGSARLARRVLRRADRLVCHASGVADACRTLCPGALVVVTDHPPDLPVRREPMPSGAVRLLAPGYVRDYKGPDLGVAAVARARLMGVDVSLTIAGEPWSNEAERLERQVRELDLQTHVRLSFGYLSDTALADLIASHHAVIAPYRSATQSGAVAQALAAGRPVVVTPVGGLVEMVEDGVNGTVARACTEDDVADAISRLVAQLRPLAEGAARTRFRWEDVARALVPELD